MTETHTTKTQRPVDSIRDRDLEASIWRNGTKEEPRFNTSFRKSYRDEDGEWRETQSYSPNDLLRLSEIMREAHHRVNGLYQSHYRLQGSQQSQTEPQDQADIQAQSEIAVDDAVQNQDWADEDLRKDEAKRKQYKARRRNGKNRHKNREHEAR